MIPLTVTIPEAAEKDEYSREGDMIYHNPCVRNVFSCECFDYLLEMSDQEIINQEWAKNNPNTSAAAYFRGCE